MTYSTPPLIDQLNMDILNARRGQDRFTATTLQEVVAAIDNAGAVPVPETIHSIGTGSTEVPRRELSAQDIQEIIQHEITELHRAIKQFGSQKNDYTDELQRKITILEKYL